MGGQKKGGGWTKKERWVDKKGEVGGQKKGVGGQKKGGGWTKKAVALAKRGPSGQLDWREHKF